MARLTNKKLIAGIFALSCAFILASCDKVEALPNNYKDPVISETAGNEKLYENEMAVIYDAIASGKSEKVVDEMLKIISTSKYGNYYGEGGLLEVTKHYMASVMAGTPDTSKILPFVQAHKAYYHSNDDKVTSEKYKADDIAIARAVSFVDTISKKVAEHFYDEVKSGSYNDENGIYREQRLAYEYYSKLYKIDVEDVTDVSNFYSGYVTHTLTKENVYEFVHIDETGKNYYRDYIERKIIPEVYKDRIVEEYILANNYSTLGRSYGRKTNIVKLTYDTKSKTFADDLVRAYSTKYILNGEGDQFSSTHVYLENAWRGFKSISLDTNENPEITACDASEEELLDKVGKTTVVSVDTGVTGLGTLKARKDTQLGLLIEDFKKAKEAESTRFATDEQTSALNKFTETGKYPKEKGLVNEIVKLAENDSYKDGWSVKNGGLSDYPSDLRDRLYNINVSNTLDNASYDPAKYDQAKDYVRPLRDSFFLVPSKTEKIDVNPLNFIFTDSSSSSYFICEVVEAPSTSKMNLENADGYVKTKETNPLKAESFAREISRVISTKDSYVTSAYTEAFKECELIYHDDVVYEYFKSTYPDLFD